MEEKNCIFCKIINKEIPCDKIYEDKNFLAFLDISPVEKGHILLIPKKHIIWMYEAEDKIISEIFKLSKKIMIAMKNSLNCDFVKLSIVGKDVPHFHIHLIPSLLKKKSKNLIKYKKGEEKIIINKITSKL